MPSTITTEPNISAAFPFESRFVDVLGSRMHYVEQGAGPCVLFLHGNPTSAYLWRNVIPHVAEFGRCVALDLIGMGRSDKPDLDYRFADHVRYLDAAIEALRLEDVTLVLHDWGSALGLHYALRHERNVRALAIMEGFLAPLPGWHAFPADKRETFQAFRTPGVGEDLLMRKNVFIEAVLPQAVVRELSEEEMDHYRAPYPDERSRKPLWRWPNEIPIAGRPVDVADAMAAYSQWLQVTDLPKLLFHVDPGVLVTAPIVQWAKTSFPRLTTVDLGPGIHYVQEDHPHAIGHEIARWLSTTIH